ncbi:hypothetical protein PENSPDRAFT_293838 [Peniophora sp. CONT]|nr:hypothetical protein PENSPDRAFT_293838 [Peniophora sp. CONT]
MMRGASSASSARSRGFERLANDSHYISSPTCSLHSSSVNGFILTLLCVELLRQAARARFKITREFTTDAPDRPRIGSCITTSLCLGSVLGTTSECYPTTAFLRTRPHN